MVESLKVLDYKKRHSSLCCNGNKRWSYQAMNYSYLSYIQYILPGHIAAIRLDLNRMKYQC